MFSCKEGRIKANCGFGADAAVLEDRGADCEYYNLIGAHVCLCFSKNDHETKRFARSG